METNSWAGTALELVQNGNIIHTFQSGFVNDEKCIESDQVDPINDVFNIRSTADNGVSY